MQYKVGDKVRIKSFKWYLKNKKDDDTIDVPCLFVYGMRNYCGKTATIVKITISNNYNINLDSYCYTWSEQMFVSIKEERKIKLKKLRNEYR